MIDIATIYARVPKVIGCRTGCHDCCGPVPMSDAEAARIATPFILEDSPFGKLTPLKPGCMTCAFSSPDGCTIYENRPLACRLFGAVDHPRMTCPHGARAKRPLTHEQAMDLIALATPAGPAAHPPASDRVAGQESEL